MSDQEIIGEIDRATVHEAALAAQVYYRDEAIRKDQEQILGYVGHESGWFWNRKRATLEDAKAWFEGLDYWWRDGHRDRCRANRAEEMAQSVESESIVRVIVPANDIRFLSRWLP